MLVVTLLLLFIRSGFANLTSSEFSNYKKGFANYTSVSTNYTRTPKPYFSFSDLGKHFDNFIHQHGKVYKSMTEMRERFEIFKDNMMKANTMNAKNPITTFGITEFADMTQDEYNRMFSGLNGPQYQCRRGTVRSALLERQAQSIDITFDWRNWGVVTPVRHQGKCNSCYAWSVIGNLEGQFARKYRRLQVFSPQQIIDCDITSLGCQNGWTTNAGMYLMYAGGAMLESDYPSTARKGYCRADPSRFAVKVISCQQFSHADEESLRRLLVQLGPLSVAVDSRNFGLYTGGIFYNCKKDINHAMLLVGYGEENGVKYWTLKNAAGPRWGENGYIRIPRGQNACGIVNEQIMTLHVA